MRPVLQIWVERELYVVRCYGCQYQCRKTSVVLDRAVSNLPCHSVRGIEETIKKMEVSR